MTRALRTSTVLVALLASGSPAEATDCSEVPGNAVASVGCGFTEGIDGWTADDFTEVAWRQDEGEPQPGCLAVRGGEVRRLGATGPCFAIEPAATYELVGHLRADGDETGSCSISVTTFSDPHCTADDDFLGGVILTLLISRWETTTTDTVETGGEARTARLALECWGGPELAVLLDNLVMRAE